MMITLDRAELLQKLELTSRIAAKHHTLPILQCVLIVAGKDGVELRATNLEVGLKAALSAAIEEEGVIAVPAELFLRTVTLMSHTKVILATEKEALVVETPASRTKIKLFASEEFPTISTFKGKEQGIDGSLFSLGIKTAAFAASQSAVKPELGSVYIRQKESQTLTFVATDSFRLSEKTLSFKGVTLEHALLIPYKNALELARVADLIGENPTFSYSENEIHLAFPNGVRIVSRLIEGNFPDYEQIIPKEYQTHVTVLSGDVVHALKKTTIFTNRFLQVSLSIDPKKHTLELRSENTDTGTTEESLSATIEGEPLTLSFNQQYLAEGFSHITDESALLSFAGIGRPLVIRGAHEKNFRYLVMPMNK